jgi:maltose/moltooligosaccharide transporter
MQRLCAVQFLTWTGLFCFFLYYSVAVAHNVFGASDPHAPLYHSGVMAANQSTALQQMVSTLFALCIPLCTRFIGRVWTHALGLLCAGLGLLSVMWLHNPQLLWLGMVGVGIGWGCILALPFALLSEYVPNGQNGVYMGLFNLFIVIPEIIAALLLGPLVQNVFGGNEIYIIGLGGAAMLLASITMLTLLPKRQPAVGAA